jgi:hypothetical protein
VFRLVPSPFTTAMIASEMPAAIRPYSIAVAPLSSDMNFLIRPFNFASADFCADFSRPGKTTEPDLRLYESGTFNTSANYDAINRQI